MQIGGTIRSFYCPPVINNPELVDDFINSGKIKNEKIHCTAPEIVFSEKSEKRNPVLEGQQDTSRYQTLLTMADE